MLERRPSWSISRFSLMHFMPTYYFEPMRLEKMDARLLQNQLQPKSLFSHDTKKTPAQMVYGNRRKGRKNGGTNRDQNQMLSGKSIPL